MIYIGIDVGGMSIKAGAVDENGVILCKDTCPTGVERGYEAVIRDIAQLGIAVAEKSGHGMADVKTFNLRDDGEGSCIGIRQDVEPDHVRRLDFLEPDALPYAALSGVPHVSALDSLFAAKLRARLAGIPHAELDDVRALLNSVGDVRVKGQICPHVRGNLPTVYVEGARVVNRLEVQQEPMGIGDGAKTYDATVP